MPDALCSNHEDKGRKRKSNLIVENIVVDSRKRKSLLGKKGVEVSIRGSLCREGDFMILFINTELRLSGRCDLGNTEWVFN